jgi:glycosyltransferase 2 family protein
MSESTLGIDWRARIRAALPQIVIGAIIGSAALVFVFRGVDWSSIGNALAHTRLSMVGLALLCVLVTLVVNTTRWWLLFTPDHRERNWFVLAAAILIGQTTNFLIPARLGEIARIYLVGTREGVSKARVMATIVIEKVIDLAVFALCIALVLAGMTLPALMRRSGVAIVIVASVLAVITFAMSFWSETLLTVVERVARYFPERWAARIVALTDAALAGLRALRDWRAGAAIWVLSAAVLFFSILTNYIVFATIGLSLPLIAAMFLTVVLRIGEAPPSLPGKLGVFQALVILGLAVFGIDRTTALTYSFVLYAVAAGPVVIAGIACVFAFRWSS